MPRTLALALALALIAPGSAAAPAPPSDPPSATILWQRAAWQIELVGDRAVALEADLRHVVAVDLATGKRRWRRAVQKKPKGHHTLSVHEGRLFLWAGPTLFELDPRRGEVVARGQILHNRPSCVLMIHGPQGGASCENGLWLFGLAPIELGKYFPASEIHIYEDLSKPHSTHYAHSARSLFGRVGDLAVVAAEHREGARLAGLFSAPAALAAVDPKTGEARWRTAELVKSGLTTGGLVADGGVAWILSESTRAVGAVDTARGELVWKLTPTAEDTHFNGDVFGDGETVAVLVDDIVRGVELATGRERWRAPAEGATRLVALTGRADPLVYIADKPLKIALATPTGRVEVLEAPPQTRALRDGDGLVLVWPGRARAYDAAGAVTGEVAGPESGTYALAPAALSGFDEGQAVVYRRDGVRLAGLPEGAALRGGLGDTIVLMVPGTQRVGPGAAVIARVPR